MKKKLLSALLCITLVATMLSGCGKGKTKEITKETVKNTTTENTTAENTTEKNNDNASSGQVLEFYHGYFQDDWQPAVEMRKIYDAFAAENPNFKPIAIQTGSDGVAEKVTSEVASGSFPNMVDLAGANALEAAINADLVLDLKQFIDEDQDLLIGVGKTNYTQNNVNGKIYTVRDQIETQGFWYNESIFIKAGAALPETWKTWEDFSEATKKIREAGYVPFILEESSSQRLAGAWMGATAGGRTMLEALPTEFGTDNLKETLTALGNEIQSNGENNISAKGDAYRDDFFKGSPVGTAKVAMCFNGVWDAGSAASSDFKNDIKPATFPAGDNDASIRFSYSSAGAGLAISNTLSEEQQELAIKFLKYMMSDEVQTKIITLCEANPASDRIDYDSLIADPVTSEATKKLIEACKVASTSTYKAKTLNNAWGGDIAKAISDQMLLFPTSRDMKSSAQEAVEVLNSLIK